MFAHADKGTVYDLCSENFQHARVSDATSNRAVELLQPVSHEPALGRGHCSLSTLAQQARVGAKSYETGCRNAACH